MQDRKLSPISFPAVKHGPSHIDGKRLLTELKKTHPGIETRLVPFKTGEVLVKEHQAGEDSALLVIDGMLEERMQVFTQGLGHTTWTVCQIESCGLAYVQALVPSMDDLPSLVTVRASSDGQALMIGRDFFKSLPPSFMSILRGELLVRKQLLKTIVELKKMVINEEAMRLVVKEIAQNRKQPLDKLDPAKMCLWFQNMLSIARNAKESIEKARTEANEARECMARAMTEFEGMHAHNLAIGLGMEMWYDRIYRTLREYGVPAYVLKHTTDEAALLMGDAEAYDRLQGEVRIHREMNIDEADVDEAIARSVRGADMEDTRPVGTPSDVQFPPQPETAVEEPAPLTKLDPSLYNEIPQEVRDAAPKSVSEERMIELAPVTQVTPRYPAPRPIGRDLPSFVDDDEEREDTLIGVQSAKDYLLPVEKPARPSPLPQPASRKLTPLGVKPQTLAPPPFHPEPMRINVPASQREEGPDIEFEEAGRTTQEWGLASDLGTAPKKK